MLLKTCLAALTVKHSRAVTKNDVRVSNLHGSKHDVGICPGSGVFKTRCECAISAGVCQRKYRFTGAFSSKTPICLAFYAIIAIKHGFLMH